MRRLRILATVLVVLAAVYLVVSLTERRGQGPAPLFPEFRAEEAAGIYISAAGQTVAIEKRDGEWTVPSEDGLPADPTGVDAVLDKVASFSRRDRVSSNPGKRQVFQVDTSGVRVGIVDAAGDTTASFIVGKVGPDYQSSYVRVAGGDDVILAPGYLKSMFDRGARPWQDRLIFDLVPDDISRLDIARGPETYTLSRGADGQWFMAEPESSACRQNAVTRLVRLLAMLRCDDFAGRLPLPGADVAGSDTTLSFAVAAGEEHRLAFGSENEDGLVHFTRDTSDVVYLLARVKVNQLIPPLEDMLPQEPAPGGAAE